MLKASFLKSVGFIRRVSRNWSRGGPSTRTSCSKQDDALTWAVLQEA